jgi:hypothetical protein
MIRSACSSTFASIRCRCIRRCGRPSSSRCCGWTRRRRRNTRGRFSCRSRSCRWRRAAVPRGGLLRGDRGRPAARPDRSPRCASRAESNRAGFLFGNLERDAIDRLVLGKGEASGTGERIGVAAVPSPLGKKGKPAGTIRGLGSLDRSGDVEGFGGRRDGAGAGAGAAPTEQGIAAPGQRNTWGPLTAQTSPMIPGRMRAARKTELGMERPRRMRDTGSPPLSVSEKDQGIERVRHIKSIHFISHVTHDLSITIESLLAPPQR